MQLHRYILFLPIACFLFSCSKTKENSNLPLHEKKVLILGNSITQNGAYVTFLEYYLRKNFPNKNLDITSIGLAGETVSGDSEKGRKFLRPCIHSRLKNALQHIAPDLVISTYGMNDGIYSEKDSTLFSHYKTGILNLKKTVENSGANLILMTPTPFDKDPAIDRVSRENEYHSYKKPFYNYNLVLKQYSEWLLTLEDIKVIDLHSSLNSELEKIKNIKPDSTFIPDAVHPNKIGHFFISKKILRDLYPDISINDVVSEINTIKKDTLYSLVKKRREIRSKGWLEYIGYTKKKTIKSNSIQPTIEKVKKLDVAIQKVLNRKE